MNIDIKTLRENASGFCLGILMGFTVRAVIYADFWWILVPLIAVCLVLLGKYKSLRDEVEELKYRLEGAEGLVPKNTDPVGQDTQKGSGSRHSERHDEVERPFPRAAKVAQGRGKGTDNKGRKVRITKISGVGMRESQTSIVGFEEHPPEEGKEYRFVSEQGTLFQTSLVMQVAPRYFQTQNATYEIEVIEED